MKLQVAPISLQGVKFVVVHTGPDLLRNTWEADMTIERLRQEFGGAQVILMAQKEDGSPTYYGNQDLVRVLADLPVDKMPWQEREVR